jgi:hypothetical protein
VAAAPEAEAVSTPSTNGGDTGQSTETGGPADTKGNANDPMGNLKIQSSNVLGDLKDNGSWRFLYGTGVSKTEPLVIQAGRSYAENFNPSKGGVLDLTQVLAGAPLAHDLTNIDQFIKVAGYSENASGSGGTTTLEVTGPNGSAVINVEGSGKVDVKDLLDNHSLLLPPH